MIEVNDVAIGYKKLVIQQKLNYTFDDGKIYGILGESGIGKSTFLKTLAGLLPPISGYIKNDNKNVYMMHQKYTNFDWYKCIDNIIITERIARHRITQETESRAIKAMQAVGLGGFEWHYPSQLSGGQQQRLALARTLFMSPEVILMDEPLSALDTETRANMQDLILKKHEETGNMIIIVTHSPEEAEKMCDEIIKFPSEVTEFC